MKGKHRVRGGMKGNRMKLKGKGHARECRMSECRYKAKDGVIQIQLL
jgi:hypothetical protein